jgi:hypothetical protein
MGRSKARPPTCTGKTSRSDCRGWWRCPKYATKPSIIRGEEARRVCKWRRRLPNHSSTPVHEEQRLRRPTMLSMAQRRPPRGKDWWVSSQNFDAMVDLQFWWHVEWRIVSIVWRGLMNCCLFVIDWWIVLLSRVVSRKVLLSALVFEVQDHDMIFHIAFSLIADLFFVFFIGAYLYSKKKCIWQFLLNKTLCFCRGNRLFILLHRAIYAQARKNSHINISLNICSGWKQFYHLPKMDGKICYDLSTRWAAKYFCRAIYIQCG